MADTTNTTAPATVTTTVAQPHPQPVADKSFTGSDIAWILGLVAVILTIVGSVYKMVDGMKTRNTTESQQRTQAIMAAITESKNQQTDHLRTLEERLKDRDSQLEKDLQTLKQDKEHYRKQREQADIATVGKFKEVTDELRRLDTRMTTQEEKTRNLDGTIKEIKELIREKMDETKDMIKSTGAQFNEALKLQSEKEEGHFKELCSSIREMSKRSPKD